MHNAGRYQPASAYHAQCGQRTATKCDQQCARPSQDAAIQHLLCKADAVTLYNVHSVMPQVRASGLYAKEAEEQQCDRSPARSNCRQEQRKRRRIVDSLFAWLHMPTTRLKQAQQPQTTQRSRHTTAPQQPRWLPNMRSQSYDSEASNKECRPSKLHNSDAAAGLQQAPHAQEAQGRGLRSGLVIGATDRVTYNHPHSDFTNHQHACVVGDLIHM